MTAVTVVPLVDEGLGNTAYLLDLGDGTALAVDASRDLRGLRAAADDRGLRVAYAAETHLHADFITGALELAASDGASVLASAEGNREFGHTALADGDEIDLGGLTLRALTTPGHTYEHVAFEVLDGPSTVGVFTGGSLLVGAAARTDLVAPERTEELARAQYRSLQRLATLDDEVAVWPTHGAGSFCSAPPRAERTSSIGAEKATNALLRAESEDAFVSALLASLGTFPRYFLCLSELNRRGPFLVADSARLTGLGVGDVRRLRAAGAEIIDVRALADFAAAHVPGSISIPLRDAFATWLGWLVDPGRPLVVVRNPDQDAAEVAWQALKIGYENLSGELAGGVNAWASAGEPVETIPLVDAEAVFRPQREASPHAPPPMAGATVLDIRQASEFAAGHVPGARHIELGDLAARTAAVPAGRTVVMCGHGERAMGAASLLARAGRADVAVLAGGPGDWAATTGLKLQVGA